MPVLKVRGVTESVKQPCGLQPLIFLKLLNGFCRIFTHDAIGCAGPDHKTAEGLFRVSCNVFMRTGHWPHPEALRTGTGEIL